MPEIEIKSYFSKEDKDFNRKMVEWGLEGEKSLGVAEDRGGKMHMSSSIISRMFPNREYDFSSEILEEYRRKWGIQENA